MYKNLKQFIEAYPDVAEMPDDQQGKLFAAFGKTVEENPKLSEVDCYKMAVKSMGAKLSEHFYSVNTVKLSEDEKTSTVEVLRAGVIRDRGLKITKQMLSDFVQHFNDNVYGTELQVNLGHNREGEAAGWIKKLFLDPVDDERLLSDIEWTPLGLEKLKNKLFKFVSAEFADRFPHFKTGQLVSNVFSGLALTNVPALKGQSPIALSEEINLTNLNNHMFKKYMQELSERKIVSKDDKALMHKLLAEVPEAEQAEHKEAVDAVDAKPEVAEKTAEEVQAEADKKAADDKAAQEAADAKAKAEAEGKTPEQLAEKLVESNKLQEQQAQEIKTLNEKIERKDLSEKFDTEFALSEKNPTGLLAVSKEKVVNLLMELSPAQRTTFSEIVSEVRAANLSTIGSTDTVELTGDMQDKIVTLAEDLMAKDKTLTVEAAQKQATAQLKK